MSVSIFLEVNGCHLSESTKVGVTSYIEMYYKKPNLASE